MFWINRKLHIEAFEDLPDNLCKSNYIDFLLFLSNMKPSLRVKILGDALRFKMIDWCEKYRFNYLPDRDEYFLIAKSRRILLLLHETDNSDKPHEYRLGLLLGYPKCCSKKISIIGEANIDLYENTVIKHQKFEGDFKWINPKAYKNGCALISHLPCNPQCQASLKIALNALSIVSHNRENKHFWIWEKLWEK